MRDLRKERKYNREQENKQFILSAAENVFAKRGYAQATMDDVAEAAQFSKATLYRYFKSKQEMFMEIILNNFDEAYKNSVRIHEKNKSSSEKLRELIHYILGYYQSKQNLSRIFIMEHSAMKKLLNIDVSKQGWHASHHPQVPQELRKILEKIFNVMAAIIEDGIRSGEFRDVDPKEACYILGALLRGFHFRGPVGFKEFTLKESTELIHDFVLHGIKKAAI